MNDSSLFTASVDARTEKRLDVWLTITALKGEGDKPLEIATTERDITELEKIRAQSIR